MQDVEPLTGSENFSFMLGIARAATSEFVELSRRNPGKFSYGSPGIGSTTHFAGELARQQAGLFITHIPYRGVSTLTSDLVGNVVEFAFMSPTGRGPPRSERPAWQSRRDNGLPPCRRSRRRPNTPRSKAMN
jgi:hypothetical protein